MTDVDEHPPQRFRFRAIVGPRASDEVVSQVCFAILTGAYHLGEYLPTTEQLAAEFNVSRPTIGDAMKVLNEAGVVLPQRGSAGGLLVVSVDIPHALISSRKSPWRQIAIDELVEARSPVEHAVADLAHGRRTDVDLRRLRESIDDMRSAKLRGDLGAWVNADLRFHHVVGRASGNQILAETLSQIMFEICLVGQTWIDEFEHAERVVRLHENMLKALDHGSRDALHNAVEQLLALVHDATGGELSSTDPQRSGSAPKRTRSRTRTSTPGTAVPSS